GETDEENGEAVDAERVARTVGKTPSGVAPQRQAAHEHGHDDRDGEVRVPDRVAEEARPDDLVHEAGRAGEEEAEEGERALRHGGGEGAIISPPDRSLLAFCGRGPSSSERTPLARRNGWRPRSTRP